MKNTFLAAIVVALGLGATVPFVGWAQDQPQAQESQDNAAARGVGGPGRPGGPGGRMGGPMGGAFAFRGVMRDLTDAQREQVKGIHERHADRIRPLAERAHAAREAVDNAVMSGNEGNLQALSIEVGQRRNRAHVRAGAGAVGDLQGADGRAEAEDRRAAEADGGAARGGAETQTGAG